MSLRTYILWSANATLHGLTAWLITGAVAGWLAGTLVRGGGFGIFVDIAVGIVGTSTGGRLVEVLGISLDGGWVGSIITTVIGAVILLFIIRLVKCAWHTLAPTSRTAVDAHVIQPLDSNMHRIT